MIIMEAAACGAVELYCVILTAVCVQYNITFINGGLLH